MGFFSKLKETLSNVADQLFGTNAPMEPVIKENRQMLEAELRLSFESAEGIQAIKNYGEEETPALKEALVGTSEALSSIETQRKTMVNTIREGYVQPFEVLVEEWKKVEQQKHMVTSAGKHVEKTEKISEKKKTKDPAKLKEGELELAEQAIVDAKIAKEAAETQLATMETEFHEKKIAVIKNSLGVLMKERKAMHQQATSTLTDVQMYIDAISVDVEMKQFVSQGTNTPEAVSEEETDFKDKLVALKNKITHSANPLTSVIKENIQLLAAHEKLTKESKEGINAYKTYAELESPDIQEVLSQFAGALETIEINRTAFVEQMKFEFIQPLEKLAEEWKALQAVIKFEDEEHDKLTKAENHLTKMQAKLVKVNEKLEEKRKPEEIPNAEKAVEDATIALEDAQTSYKKAQEATLAKANEFGALKATTIKDGLNSLIERNLKFHTQALNIIDNAEMLVKDL